ncbi:MAG: hypothetical protein P8Y47_07995 [Alphaproteobacteria bacterium]
MPDNETLGGRDSFECYSGGGMFIAKTAMGIVGARARPEWWACRLCSSPRPSYD